MNYTDLKPDAKKVTEYKRIRLHVEGNVEDADFLLRTYQPSEPEWAIKYKKDNFRPITTKSVNKIFSVLAKIKRANDFIIKANKNNSKVKESETIDKYCLQNFGVYKSIVNWVFNYHFKNLFQDPNGVVVFMPNIVFDFINGDTELIEINPTEYLKPMPYYFPIDKIVNNTDDKLVIILEDNAKWLNIDTQNITIVEKKKQGEKYIFISTIIFNHNLGYIPKVVNGGTTVILDNKINYISFIQSCIPDFEQALLENIDKNVAIKMHIFPEKAVYGQYSCHDCNGIGQIESYIDSKSIHSTCNSCNGTGIVNTSTFGVIQVRPPKGGESDMPSWAPAKYIEKDLETVKFVTEDIKYLINQGFEAVGMAHLNDAPLAESGVAKSYDWEQTHMFLFKVADYLCQVFLTDCIKIMNDYRYSNILNESELKEQLLIINTPQQFDILGVTQLEEQISLAKSRGISPSILEEMEKEYIRKKFSGDIQQMNLHLNIIELDPLRGVTQDEILSMSSLNVVSKETICVHNLINQFVYKAFEENKEFAELELSNRNEVINKYAVDYLSKLPKEIDII